jgi:hypothetical protein
MKRNPLMIYMLLFIGMPALSCCRPSAENSNIAIEYIGCTPGDGPLKKTLNIQASTKVEFIRWVLTLTPEDASKGKFSMNIIYGESQPNTKGFKGGGEKKSCEGSYLVEARDGHQVYEFHSRDLSATLSMIALDDNHLHLLTDKQKLFVGNGGWSYTLGLRKKITNGMPSFASIGRSVFLCDTCTKAVFDGRTPCQEFAREQNLTVVNDCFKLKWRIILYRDPKTLFPSRYEMKRVTKNLSELTGTWSVIKGTRTNPDAIVYELTPSNSKRKFRLLQGDENVLFVMRDDDELFGSDENFSYTLNRKSD